MRVTHVAPTPFGRDGLFGGGERYPLELARALARRVDCELITFGRHARLEREAAGLRRRTIRALFYQGGHPAHAVAPALLGALRGADIVHAHHMRATPSRFAAVLALLRAQSAVVTDHGLQGDSWGGLLPRLFRAFLCVSAYSARELRAPAARTRVIYGGADPARFSPDPSIGRQGVLFVGRLTPHKGVDRLLSALPARASLTIVGSTGHDPRWPERDYPLLLRSLAEGRSVRFVESADEALLPSLYRAARVFVLPSVDRTCYGRAVRVSELLGLALIEAMTSGTPVIASRVGGVPEVVVDGETGILVPPGDVSALHDALASLLDDDALAARLGANARALVLERFTWSQVAERCLAAYAELA